MQLPKRVSTNERPTERRGGQKSMRRRCGIRSQTIYEWQRPSHDCQFNNADRTFPRRGAVVLNSKEIVSQIRRSSNQKKNLKSTIQVNERISSFQTTIDDFLYHSDINDTGCFRSKDKEIVQHKHNTSQMDIVVDKERGFYADFERNLAFIEILRTCFVDMYIEAKSKTHRQILLNTILAHMYDRGFRFLIKHKEKYHIIEDEIFILKKIRSVMRKEKKVLRAII